MTILMKSTTLYSAVFWLALFLSSCGFSHTTLKGTETWIPPGMDAKNTILIVEKYPYSEKFNQKMDDYFAKKYGNRYVVLDMKTILSKTGKYADSNVYRYALLWSKSIVDVEEVGSSTTHHNLYMDCHFYDRLLQKEYPKTGRTYKYARKAYVPVINTLAKKLN
jgi:hypothetical protein